jgi:type I restriction enzyme M protein
MDPKTGRCAILFPHGVLFRNEEAEMRRKLVELDLVECVLGLGPGLFYNSPMEACVLVCRTSKPSDRAGKILLIDAVKEISRERAQSFLRAEHQSKILDAYRGFADVPGFATVATTEDVLARDGSLSIPLYVKKRSTATNGGDAQDIASVWSSFEQDGREFWTEMDSLVEMLDGVVSQGVNDA